MTVDFYHNQIIRDTVTESFKHSFCENLLPAITELYGDSLRSVMLYEDHIADGYRVGGIFYYPLTLITDSGAHIRWVSWQVSNYRQYDKFNPFTYKGKENLTFDIDAIPPIEVAKKQEGRAFYFDGVAMPLTVSAQIDDVTFLSGKYSQRFADELSVQITAAIEAEVSVVGLAESGVELIIPFAPGSFLEHVVGNVTYRRVLIKARGCAARDLWIKWKRLDGAGTYTVADSVCADEILFELAEDVPGKIKEKEYRFLAASSVEEYQIALSRKNITSWREMMRRVIKRGEVMKTDKPQEAVVNEKVEDVSADFEPITPVNAVPENESVSDRLSRMLADIENEEDEPEEEINSDLNEMLRNAIGIGARTTEEAVSAPKVVAESYVPDSVDEYEESPVSLEAETTEVAQQPMVESASEDYELKLRRELEAKLRAEMEEELRAKNREAEELRARLEAQLKAEAREKELMAEAAMAALEEQRRLEKEREEEKERIRADEERLAEARRKAEEEKRLAEQARLKAEAEAMAMAKAQTEQKPAETAPGEIKYISKTARLIFKYSVAQTATKKIHEIILATIKYFHKEDVYIRIKATVPDANTVVLEFVKIPENEMPLLVNIIKVLGKSDLGIIKAVLD